jgi:hypothetical protein
MRARVLASTHAPAIALDTKPDVRENGLHFDIATE